MKINSQSSVAILGFGVEGKAIFEYLKKHGVDNITICDKNKSLELPGGVKSILGNDYLMNLESFDYVFRSPGVPYFDPELQKSIKSGVNVASVIKFFFKHCPAEIIGVSGTKGKGTTSTLIYKILKNAGKDVYLGGNIGEPPVNFLDKLNAQSIVVLELSSFQLQDLNYSPQISVLLNTTIDHLDWHKGKDEYWKAKSSLFKYQEENDLAILNLDYSYASYFAKFTKGVIKYVSSHEITNGAYVKGNQIYYQKNPLISIDEVGLIGKHNWENIMPSIVVAKHLHIDNEVIAQTIKDFKGLPYRLELVNEVAGVRFYNDSFSTNPETSIAGVKSFSEPLALIAGGYDKGLNYQKWAQVISLQPNLKFIALIGDLADQLEDELLKNNCKIKLEKFKSFEKAIEQSYKNVSSDSGIVLLSPAAASFDMFANYKVRGQKFIEIVDSLKNKN